MTARCIRGKAAAGRVGREKAEELATLFEDFEADLRARNAARPAEEAADMATRALKHQQRTKRRARLQQMKAQADIRARIMENRDDAIEAALSLLDFDPRSKIAGPNVRKTSENIRGLAQARMVDTLDTFGSKAAGLDVLSRSTRERRKVGLRNMVRELFGEATGDQEAKAAANGAADAMEFLRQLFNGSGGNIAKRENWGLPQAHSRQLVNSVGEDDWVDFVVDRVDRSRMIDPETDLPFTGAKLRRVLSETYKDIVTDGLRDVKPGGAIGRSLARRRAESRFLIFRDADAWLEYQERFGEGDPFQTILAHINGMAKDIATMRILGPNPDASVRFMEGLVAEARGAQALEKKGRAAMRAAGGTMQGRPAIRDLYAVVSGQIYHPDNQFWAGVSAANRNVLTSAMLGGAFFSAIADRTFTRVTANLSGIPAGKTLLRHMKLMAPGSDADRKLAQRAGFINDVALGNAIGQARYIGEVVGPEWSRRLSDSVLRLSLLSPWTTWGRNAFGMEFLGHITDQMGKRFGELPAPLRRSFDRHGITSADWEAIRGTPLFRDEATGAEILRPQDIMGQVEDAGGLFQRRFEVANKLQSMILTEMDFAVPQVTARTQALLSFGKQPGTFAGEVTRNTFLFKSFPITMIQTHLRRAAFGNLTGAEKAKYIAHMVIGTAVMGTLGEQLSQVSKGRDPLPMDPTSEEGRKTLLKGMMRGGGAGIFGDFIFSDVNRFGGGIEGTLLGPVFGTQVPQFTRLTVGNIQELVKQGETQRAGRELTRFVETMMPGRSLWYSRLAMERLIFDEMQKMIDPDYARSFRAMESRARREFNQRFFSPPGDDFPPARGPDLERAFE